MAMYVRHYLKVRSGRGGFILVSPCTLAAPVAASSLDSPLSTDGPAEGDKSDCHRYLRASLAQRHHTCMSDGAVAEKPHIRRWRNGLKWLVLPTDPTERH